MKGELDLDTSLNDASVENNHYFLNNSHEAALKVIQELAVEINGEWRCKRCGKVCINWPKLKNHLQYMRDKSVVQL